jgi:invasion protein IalB
MKRHILTSAAAAVALLATFGIAGTNAQQPKPGAAPAKGAAPAPAAAAAPAAPSWVKLCEQAPFVGQDPKDPSKEIQASKSICLTHHERLDAASGMVLVSAAVREIEGAEKKHFMVMLPLGMALPPGMQVGVYPPDMWAAIQKGEKVDDSKLDPLKLAYTLCHAAGCTAEMEATPDVIKRIQAGAGIIVFAINGNGSPIAFPAPLNGFSEALAGAPADNKAYSEARKALMGQIEENRKKMLEEYRKQNQDLQKVAPKSGQAPTAAAPGGAAAPKKP